MKANYQVRDDEKHLYHVRFVKIIKEGKRTRDVYHDQMFTVKEWVLMTKGMGKKKATLEQGLAGITQMDEIKEILHDPTMEAARNAELERLAKIKADKEALEALEKAKAEQKAKDVKESKEIRAFLTENEVEFDARLGLEKLRKLKNELKVNQE